MNWDAYWKLMDDMVKELRKSGETIPTNIMKDLRSAKTMMEILKMDRSRSENLLKIEEFLNNIESYLAVTAKERFGSRYVEEWTQKLIEAQRSDQAEKTKPLARFPFGIPRDKRWIRIQESKEIPLEKIKNISKEIGLKNKIQKDGYVLVYGEENGVKRFVKKMVELLHERDR